MKTIAKAIQTRWFTFYKVLLRIITLLYGMIKFLENYQESEAIAKGFLATIK